MVKGRPVKSKIRQNIVEILHYMGEGYGYQVAKIYNEIFPAATQRSIYYNLQKGILTKEIAVHKIEQEEGEYSWGSMVEKKYYSLGKNAEAKGDKRVKDFLQTWQKLKKENSPSKFTSFVNKFRKEK
ncbi:MAG TPA: hypothetical protein VJB13_05205 [Candidatus Nanoarchaeia archaeon]|nr:hypothetical protein [Candidatus Nanoarchaeia archaeon]